MMIGLGVCSQTILKAESKSAEDGKVAEVGKAATAVVEDYYRMTVAGAPLEAVRESWNTQVLCESALGLSWYTMTKDEQKLTVESLEGLLAAPHQARSMVPILKDMKWKVNSTRQVADGLFAVDTTFSIPTAEREYQTTFLVSINSEGAMSEGAKIIDSASDGRSSVRTMLGERWMQATTTKKSPPAEFAAFVKGAREYIGAPAME